MILDRDEGSFFERVVTVHPFASKTQVVALNNVHVVHEFFHDVSGDKTRFRIIRWFNFAGYIMKLVRRVRSILRKEGIDIVRSTDPYWTGFIGWLVTRVPRLPFCVSIHADYDKRYELAGPAGAPVIFGSRVLAKWLQRFILHRADRVMPIRESLGQKAIMDGARPETVRIIPHGIDTKAFCSEPSYDVKSLFGIREDQKIISFVGRLSRENYVDDVLAIARNLINRNDFVIVMAGGGPEEERLRQELDSDRGLSRLILLVGFQPRDLVVHLRRASAASLCFMGGFSLIEACAAARPVIAYDVEWHHELVSDYETGFLVSESDTKTVARAIEYLLDHLVEAKEMGARARALAFERHDISKTSKIKWAYYRELLANCRLG